jgi:hypothetical protein
VLLLVCGVVIGATSLGYGPLAKTADEVRFLLTQGVLGVLSISTMLANAALRGA